MDIICFGQQNWNVCWTEKQHLLTRLVRRGHRALYVDPLPDTARAGLSTIGRWAFPHVGAGGLRQMGDGLWVYTHPFVGALGRKLNARARRLVLGRVAGRLRIAAPVALVLNPTVRWLVDGVRPAARVYFAVDEWTAYGGLESQRDWLRRQEEAMLREADVALAVSPRLLDRFRQVQPRSYFFENAADVEHFAPERLAASAPHPVVAALPRPRVLFVGQIDERLDQDLLIHFSDVRPAWQIVLAGRVKDGVDVTRLGGRSNIHLLGFQPYEDLPGVLREADVCVVPYRLTTLTQSCNPAKVYEYLATGLPVVSSPLEGLNACRDAIVTAETPQQFVSAIEAALADPAAGRERRLAVAAANAWDARTDQMEDRLQEALRVASERRGSNGRGKPAPAQRLVSPRRAARRPVRLDEKDEAQRQLSRSFHRPPLTPERRVLFELTRAAGWAYYAGRLAARFASGRRPVAVRRILVVRHACLGDLLVFLPTLAALRRKYPAAKIVLGVQPGTSVGQLLGRGDVDEVRVLEFLSRPSRLARYRGAWELFREGYDLLVCGVGYFLIREAFFSGAPVRAGLYDDHPLQRLLTHALPLDPNRHEADNNLALTEALGCRATGAERVPTLVVDAASLAGAAAELSRRLRLPDRAPVVLVHPGSKRPSRRWPAERFAELIGRLLDARADHHVVITGVEEELPLVESVAAAVPPRHRSRVHAAAGATPLSALVALLDRSAAVVCNDTGVMHLARARGRPLLALLGPENDRRWGPYPIGAAPAVALRHRVPCAPCVRWDCEALYCMRSLSVDEASAALDRLLSEAQSPPHGATDGETLLPLRRVVRHRTWRDLAAAGMDLPVITVVVLPGPQAGGGGAPAGDRTPEPQDYPNVQWLRSADDGAGCVEDHWRAALPAASGEYIVAWSADVDWAHGKLGEAVAALVRTPDAAAVVDGRVLGRDAIAVASMWRRDGAPEPGLLLRTAVARELTGGLGTVATDDIAAPAGCTAAQRAAAGSRVGSTDQRSPTAPRGVAAAAGGFE